jgi:phosphoserine phosphatase RsbU/P
MFKNLIIDDDPIVRAALKRTHHNQGYDANKPVQPDQGTASPMRYALFSIIKFKLN